ncbi:MAG TPA: DUF4874 domain-containing protein [Gemmatimonadaceae bacterium]|nr:DUF4874 domain-containing protein [Gemmatimonadaceae bacterium]
MRFLLWICALTACAGNDPASPRLSKTEARLPTPLAVTNTFTPNDTTISTSEGAPYHFCNFWKSKASSCLQTKVPYVPICLSGEVDMTSTGCSAQPAVTGPLSEQMLADMDARIAAFQGTGARLMVRFAYNWGPIDSTSRDARLAVILHHIDQVAPILLRHRDLIFALEAGYIGTWGEWHNSTNGNDSASARKAVLDRERRYFGGVFPILVRDAGELVQYTGNLTPPADFGIHDDFYASSATDAGTWQTCNPAAGYCLSGYTTSQLATYGALVAAKTMFAGEFPGVAYPPLQNCDSLSAYSYRYHPQSIGTQAAPPACALGFSNRVGTRIELRRATITGTPVPHGRLLVSVTLANAGFGRVLRERPARLVFVSDGKVVHEYAIPLGAMDLRRLVSASTPEARTFEITVTLPESFPRSGSVTAAILIPDAAPSLRQPAYALPFNSRDQHGKPVFDPATGYNVIGTFDVT